MILLRSFPFEPFGPCTSFSHAHPGRFEGCALQNPWSCSYRLGMKLLGQSTAILDVVLKREGQVFHNHFHVGVLSIFQT